MIGRNCGVFTEDDLLLSLEADEGAVVGDSSLALRAGSDSRPPFSRAASLQPSMSRFALPVTACSVTPHWPSQPGTAPIDLLTAAAALACCDVAS